MTPVPQPQTPDIHRLPCSCTLTIPDLDEDHVSEGALTPTTPSLLSNLIPPPTIFEDPTTIDGFKTEEGSFRSPVFSHLPCIKPELLTVASAEAQTLRRSLMRDSNILIVQGGYASKMFIYDRLKQLGVNVYIMDDANSIWARAAEDGKIVQFIQLEFSDNHTVFDRAMQAVSDCASHVRFDAVTTYFEDAVALAARMASAMRLEVNPVEACEKARNKRRTREAMEEFGLAVPRYRRVLCEDDIPAACQDVGFPAILKPAFGAASMGVIKAESVEEAVSSYQKLFSTLTVEEDSIWAQGTEMVLEEYYEGDEFDVDVLLSDGVAVYAKVSDNWACWEPWFQETGTNCPSLYPEEKQKELIDLSVECTLALGFRSGCFHVECKYTEDGARLIEVNARMGGVSVRDANLVAWGVDLVEEHAMSALKIPIRPLVPKKALKYFAEAVVNAPYSGLVVCDNWLEVAEDARVLRVEYLKKKGEWVVGPEDGLPDWIAEIICVSDLNGREAVDLLAGIVTEAKVPIEARVKGREREFFFPSHCHPFV